MIYDYGIDLAENLNYCAIIVGAIDFHSVHLQSLRKFQNLRYPQLEAFLVNDMFSKYPPSTITVDYTSEKSFSETLEARMNPLFLNPHSAGYQKWRYVRPYVFSQASKLNLMQNLRLFIHHGWFKMPEYNPHIPPEVWALIEELLAQIERITAEPTHGEIGLKFPKPYQHDDDLAIALGLMLDGAREKMTGASGGGSDQISIVDSYDALDANYQANNSIKDNRLAKMLKNLNLGTEHKVKIKRAGERDWWEYEP
jgi:hypothetical protein